MSKLVDMTGLRFGRLTVISRTENNRQGKAQWLCSCDCGKEIVRAAADLKKNGDRQSCGCMRGAWIAEKQRTHGMSQHPAYSVWHSMKQRCTEPTHHAWKNYGCRGIKVCERWLNSFENFWADMGPSYARGLELDRKDNDQGYSPENCRWIPRKSNMRNRRSSRVIDSPLGRMTVAELAEKSGIGETTLLYRLDNGWPTELLLTEPNVRNPSTTSGIVVKGTNSASATP